MSMTVTTTVDASTGWVYIHEEDTATAYVAADRVAPLEDNR